MNATIDAIEDLARTLMLSSYASSRPDLVALYERAKEPPVEWHDGPAVGRPGAGPDRR